ncbi:triose-phosphate isomerase [Trichloromonas sp.]|uniref:triose-phosphate isomerase n=1 Tax=Trichloromonas sp. TaxID=3069249 RepID=UPI002A4BD8FC|nr:triose-phosphate isomerase [Trichloromonas sp.]
MRKPMIAGNWKLHKTIGEALDLATVIKKETDTIEDIDIVIAPVFTSLAKVAEQLVGSNIGLSGQNCYPAASGAFTGEVSPALLRDAGCRYCIVGHSERRQLFGESDSFINEKVQALLAAGLGVIFCIGETLEEREDERMYEVLAAQVRDGLRDITAEQMAQVVVAYEPVWAIGTGKTATDQQAEEAHAFVRGLLRGFYTEEVADATRILYGGSVKPDNVDGLMAQMDVDGALVGGASLKAEDFLRIIRFRRSPSLED